jgi:mono/diheme cytochrome c family protein
MTNPSENTGQATRKTSPWPAVIAVVVLLALAALFAGEMLQISTAESDAPPVEKTLTADSYSDIVATLLVDADVTQGEAMTKRYGCVACHAGAGAENKLAPLWPGVATRAATRRPPLSAAAYLYESIVHPGALEVDGYSGNMPIIYGQQIPERDLGDIIAYLLTLTE